ncbi:MAG: hypothetical protein AAGB93_23325 [Planctomycetota bacterium]
MIDGARTERLERAVSVPDVDGDGASDLLLLPVRAGFAGHVVLRSSADRSDLWNVDVQDELAPHQVCELSTAIEIGDFTGDGNFNVAVSCVRVLPFPATVFILDGHSGQEALSFPIGGSGTGTGLGALGDVNGDGFTDLCVGSGPAEQRVYFGPDATLGYVIPGPVDGIHGSSGVGDLDADGGNDFILGWAEEGLVTVHSGRTAAEIGRFCPVPGFSCLGTFGFVSSPVGDVNGDSFPDFAVCSPNIGDPAFGFTTGFVQVRSGADFSVIHHVQRRTSVAIGGFGSNVVSRSDVNGDGVHDVATCGIASGLPGDNGALISGRTGQILYRALLVEDGGILDLDTMVTAATTLDDIDGDGYDDWSVGNGNCNLGGVRSGRIVILAGGPGDVEQVCDSTANSTGEPARLLLYDAITAFRRGLEIQVRSAIPDGRAFLLYGLRASTPSVLGGGLLCVDRQSAQVYGTPLVLDADGDANQIVNWGSPPIASAWVAGSSWTLQAVFRDPGSAAGANATNAIEVTFNE